MSNQQTTIHCGIWRAALVVCLGAALANANAASADRYELRAVHGSVEIGSGEPPSWRPAQPGDWLRAGEALRTGPSSKVALHADGQTVRVYENSLLRLPAENLDAFEIQGGNSLFQVNPRYKQGRPFEVESPEIIATVKGTRFYVSLDSGPGTAISVFDGSVELRERNDEEAFPVMLREGFSARGGAGLALKMWVNELDDPWRAWEEEAFSPPKIDSLSSALGGRTLREAVQGFDDDLGEAFEPDARFYEIETPASANPGGWGSGASDIDDDDVGSGKGNNSGKGSSGNSGNSGRGLGNAGPSLDND